MCCADGTEQARCEAKRSEVSSAVEARPDHGRVIHGRHAVAIATHASQGNHGATWMSRQGGPRDGVREVLDGSQASLSSSKRHGLSIPHPCA
jgi:hypothetical protein